MKIWSRVCTYLQPNTWLLAGMLIFAIAGCSSDHKATLHYDADSTVNPAGPVNLSSSSSSSTSSSGAPINPNLVVNGGLEDGVEPWRSQGEGVVIEQSTDVAHSGTHSLFVSGRSMPWHAPVMDLPLDFPTGRSYTASAWVYLPAGSANSVFKISMKRVDQDGEAYPPVAETLTPVAPGTWVKMTGSFVHTSRGSVTELFLYVEAVDAGVEYYVDDLEIRAGPYGLAWNEDKFLGNVIAGYVPTDFDTYWNQVTPENASKWGSVEATRDVMDWTDLDMAYDYAVENNMPFKLHTLIWNQQKPEWIDGLPTGEQFEEIEEWYSLLSQRYPETAMIDVVNEPLHAEPTFKAALGGDGATGWDWVITSFELAREYFPTAELHINDYGIINDTAEIANYLEIVALLKDRDLIDAIGIQAHYFSVDTLSAQTIIDNLNLLAEADLPIYVSELDITGTTEQEQRDRYAEKFPAFWEHPAVAGVTLWGYVEGETWRNDTGLRTAEGKPKLALLWLLDYFWK